MLLFFLSPLQLPSAPAQRWRTFCVKPPAWRSSTTPTSWGSWVSWMMTCRMHGERGARSFRIRARCHRGLEECRYSSKPSVSLHPFVRVQRVWRIKHRKCSIGNIFSENMINKMRDLAWATAKKSKNRSDWQHFRHLRSKRVSQIRKVKSYFYVNEICDSSAKLLNNGKV